MAISWARSPSALIGRSRTRSASGPSCPPFGRWCMTLCAPRSPTRHGCMTGIPHPAPSNNSSLGWSLRVLRSRRPAPPDPHRGASIGSVTSGKCRGSAIGASLSPMAFEVAVGTLASTRLYEELLGHDLGLGSEHAFRVITDTWPSLAAQEAEVRCLQPTTNMVERALEEIRAKYVTRDEIIPRLRTIANCWPILSARLRDQLIPSGQLRRLLHSAGWPNHTRTDRLDRRRSAPELPRRPPDPPKIYHARSCRRDGSSPRSFRRPVPSPWCPGFSFNAHARQLIQACTLANDTRLTARRDYPSSYVVTYN